MERAKDWVLLHRWRLTSALLVALCLWELVGMARVRHSVPTDAQWSSAADFVRQQHRQGDLIVFAPDWVDPVGRQWLGDLLTIEDVARMDLGRYGRIWEISIGGATSSELPHGQTNIEAEQSTGPIDVRLHTKSHQTVTWHLGSHSSLYEIDYAPRKCRALRIPSSGRPARFSVSDALLDQELVVYAGLTDFRSRRDNRARAIVTTYVDDQPVGTLKIGNDTGWVAMPPATTVPGPHKVEFVAELDPAGQQSPIKLNVCIAAESRSAP